MSDFLSAMANSYGTESSKRLAWEIAETLDGHPYADAIMALCFHLNRFLDEAPDAEVRDEMLAGLMVLIDPPEGTG